MENTSVKFWKSFAVLLILLILGLLLFLFFRPGDIMRHPNPRDGGGPAKFMIEKLKFTKEQEQAFIVLKTAHHDSILKLDAEGKMLREHFFDGLKSEISISTHDSLLTCILNNQKNKESVTYDHFAAVKKLCNPEQEIIFNDILQEILDRLKPPTGGHMHDERH